MKAIPLGLVLADLLSGTSFAADLDKVSVALGWLRNGQYAPLMVADAQGFFEAEGIELEIIDGGPGKNPMPMVGVGQADFGIGGGASIFLARLAEAPVPVKALGAISQIWPYAFMTITDADAPEPTPQDLVGKTVGLQADGQQNLDAITRLNGIDPASVKVEVVLATPEPLLLGQVDFFTGNLNNQAFQIDKEIAAAPEGSPLHGKVRKNLLFNDHAFAFYHDVVFTSDKVIAEKPELISRFLRALAKGVEFTVENPEQSITDVVGYPDQVEDLEKITWRMPIQRGLVLSEGTKEHGYLWMEPSAWEAAMNFYKESNQITETLPVDEVMTNEFNPGIPSSAAE